MSVAAERRVGELLAESFAAWGVAAQVEPVDGRGVIVHSGDKTIRIEAASQQAMFRWMVAIDGRQRPAISIVAVLRQVRQALDPSYTASRVRITVAPLVPY
jgi:hypothetical protein